ncbi:MAG: TetR/AcrR family transcriptional regulator [Ruminococcus sp.]|jgi:AcrR family transcriptional regulator
MTRITKEPEERRQEIIDTAVRVFYEKGYEKTSISDIAREMKVAQGLCYRYFSSKEELFDTALDQYAQKQVDQICGALDPRMSLTELIENMPAFPETEDDGSYTQKICHAKGNIKFHNQLSLKICSKLQPVVKRLLDAADKKGEIHVKDTETVSSFCVYGQLGMLLNQEVPAKERVERIRRFLLELIKSLS